MRKVIEDILAAAAPCKTVDRAWEFLEDHEFVSWRDAMRLFADLLDSTTNPYFKGDIIHAVCYAPPHIAAQAILETCPEKAQEWLELVHKERHCYCDPCPIALVLDMLETKRELYATLDSLYYANKGCERAVLLSRLHDTTHGFKTASLDDALETLRKTFALYNTKSEHMRIFTVLAYYLPSSIVEDALAATMPKESVDYALYSYGYYMDSCSCQACTFLRRMRDETYGC